MKKRLEHYFATYSNDECFSTSDELIFHKKTDAVAHGNTLQNQKVEEHKRADYPTKEPKQSAADKKAAKEVGEKASGQVDDKKTGAEGNA